VCSPDLHFRSLAKINAKRAELKSAKIDSESARGSSRGVTQDALAAGSYLQDHDLKRGVQHKVSYGYLRLASLYTTVTTTHGNHDVALRRNRRLY
jgi:hypothetical protein